MPFFNLISAVVESTPELRIKTQRSPLGNSTSNGAAERVASAHDSAENDDPSRISLILVVTVPVAALIIRGRVNLLLQARRGPQRDPPPMCAYTARLSGPTTPKHWVGAAELTNLNGPGGPAPPGTPLKTHRF